MYKFKEEAMIQHNRVRNEIAQSVKRGNSFFVQAGAGAGKTKSLVETLEDMKKVYGYDFKKDGRKIAVITFTDAATLEIKNRLMDDSIFQISTIHSFAWENLKHLQFDLIESLDEESIEKVTYSVLNDLADEYNLHHHEVVEKFIRMLNSKEKFCQIISNQYPFILIDECQDTQTKIIDAFFDLYKEHNIILGLFGDMMQRIYLHSHQNLNELVEEHNFDIITKEWNWRSSPEIVKFINRVRALDIDLSKENRSFSDSAFSQLAVKEETKKNVEIHVLTLDEEKHESDIVHGSHVLVLEHKMAAKREGFQDLHNYVSSFSKKKNSFLDGDLGELKEIEGILVPLYQDIIEDRSPIDLMFYLREYNIAFQTGDNVDLKVLQKDFILLCQTLKDTQSTLGNILDNIGTTFDFRYLRDSTDEFVEGLKSIKWVEFIKYFEYVNSLGIGTQHSSKGLEYPRVSVILSDNEQKWNLYNFSRLLGIQQPTENDLKKYKEGKDTTLTRTQNIFYVACSRAMEELKIIYYVPKGGKEKVKERFEFLFEDVCEIV
ncbi:UvrD-helicase domain-containing protein [Halobacillus salinus]|uniref:ATP-dependent helicase n=1 Tax=Halobacillus salinus TaxID=192814 RepID=A0A4Z0GWF0_9BACI|nr:UvrD-helicase domain-containing protein [Halobacillus salinus]TGB01074.1 ATP-dependent helicase [Halobacillus salinus]